jgi:hypothetical protein
LYFVIELSLALMMRRWEPKTRYPHVYPATIGRLLPSI